MSDQQANTPMPSTTDQTPQPTVGDLAAILESNRRTAGVVGDYEPPSIGEAMAERMKEFRLAPEVSDAELDRRAAESREREHRAKMSQRHAEWSTLVAARGVRYDACTIENFQAPTAAHRAVRERATEFRSEMRANIADGIGCILYGPVGTGKDHLMAAFMRHAVLGLGATVRWVNGQDLFGEIRDGITDEVKEANIVRKYSLPAILAISDPQPVMGALTSHQANMLFRIVEKRCNDRKPTWATINAKDFDDARDRLSPAIIDRLKCQSFVFHCNWASYRRAADVVKTPSITGGGY